jgi:hypothetical protein
MLAVHLRVSDTVDKATRNIVFLDDFMTTSAPPNSCAAASEASNSVFSSLFLLTTPVSVSLSLFLYLLLLPLPPTLFFIPTQALFFPPTRLVTLQGRTNNIPRHTISPYSLNSRSPVKYNIFLYYIYRFNYLFF